MSVILKAYCAGGQSPDRLFEVIKQGGKLLSIAGMPSAGLAEKFQVETRLVSSNLSAENLAFGLKLVQEDKLKAMLAKTFKMEEAAVAQDYVLAGGTNRKVVLISN